MNIMEHSNSTASNFISTRRREKSLQKYLLINNFALKREKNPEPEFGSNIRLFFRHLIEEFSSAWTTFLGFRSKNKRKIACSAKFKMYSSPELKVYSTRPRKCLELCSFDPEISSGLFIQLEVNSCLKIGPQTEWSVFFGWPFRLIYGNVKQNLI